MNKPEAIQFMENGQKATHTYFQPHEWVTVLPNGDYQFEDGVSCSKTEFWQSRSDEHWIGWLGALERINTMASNNPSNSVKHKVNGYNIALSRTKCKWVAKQGSTPVFEGKFKECVKYCKQPK